MLAIRRIYQCSNPAQAEVNLHCVNWKGASQEHGGRNLMLNEGTERAFRS